MKSYFKKPVEATKQLKELMEQENKYLKHAENYMGSNIVVSKFKEQFSNDDWKAYVAERLSKVGIVLDDISFPGPRGVFNRAVGRATAGIYYPIRSAMFLYNEAAQGRIWLNIDPTAGYVLVEGTLSHIPHQMPQNNSQNVPAMSNLGNVRSRNVEYLGLTSSGDNISAYNQNTLPKPSWTTGEATQGRGEPSSNRLHKTRSDR